MDRVTVFRLAVVALVCGLNNWSTVAGDTCGYEACNLGEEGKINVHLIPHTHDDTGWKKTVDQYYYGSHVEIVTSGVQYILDTTMDELWKNPERRFTWAEVAFLYRWWNQVDDATKQKVKDMVNQGRLEFAMGGWCVNDEGSTHYNAIIDQHTLGLQFLQQHFGDCALPKIGWLIDTFGHSKEQSYIYSQFGMDGVFFSRLDYQDYSRRRDAKEMEFMWQGSAKESDASGAMFTHILRDGYGPPYVMFPLIFEPVADDPRLKDNNVELVQENFKQAVRLYLPNYSSNHMIFMSGEDFEYENARRNFKNNDKLIEHTNGMDVDGQILNVFYSTPACYIAAVNAANLTYTKVTDDFMPMATGDNTFWSGYFSSRTGLKGYGRRSNNVLQVCKQMDILANPRTPDETAQPKIDTLRQAVAVLQHHDAITGTQWQPVADDYTLRMHEGTIQCQEVMADSLQNLINVDGSETVEEPMFCPLANISYCPFTENEPTEFSVTLYNPLGHTIQHYVRIPVVGNSFQVVNSSGSVVESATFLISNETMKIAERVMMSTKATDELVFEAQLPPLGFHTFLVSDTSSMKTQNEVSTKAVDDSISNGYIRLTFSETTGLPTTMENIATGLSIPFSQNFYYYHANPGSPTSSAYTLRPDGTTVYPIGSTATTSFYKESVAEEARQVFSNWGSQVVRVYPRSKCAEFEWTIGPIPSEDGIGREVITRYETNFTTDGNFHTDSNGRQMIARRRDFRPTWNFANTEPIAGNYFPINSKIYIQDDASKVQLTILTDRSHGGSSIQDGNMEIMLHRRLSGEMNETGADGKGLVLRGKNLVCLETIDDSASVHREQAQRLFMAPVMSVADNSMDYEEHRSKYNMMWSGLSGDLPRNVHLLTMMRWDRSHILLRLEHFYEPDDDAELSQDATVSLKDFTGFEIKSVSEMTLGGDRLLSKTTRFSWNVQNEGRTQGGMGSGMNQIEPPDFMVTLKPMQIRTMLIQTSENPVTTPDPTTGSGCRLLCLNKIYIILASVVLKYMCTLQG